MEGRRGRTLPIDDRSPRLDRRDGTTDRLPPAAAALLPRLLCRPAAANLPFPPFRQTIRHNMSSTRMAQRGQIWQASNTVEAEAEGNSNRCRLTSRSPLRLIAAVAAAACYCSIVRPSRQQARPTRCGSCLRNDRWCAIQSQPLAPTVAAVDCSCARCRRSSCWRTCSSRPSRLY